MHSIDRKIRVTRAARNEFSPRPAAKDARGLCAMPDDPVRSHYRNFFFSQSRWQFFGGASCTIVPLI